MKKAVSLLLALALLFSLCGLSVAAEEIAGGTADSGTQIATPAEAETPENTPNGMDTVEDTEQSATEENTEEGTVETPPPDLAGGVVTEFHYERSFVNVEKQTSSYNKENTADLYNMLTGLENVLYCTVRLPSGENVQAMCTASWNTDELTLEQAGRYTVIAAITPPEGCAFGEGVRTQIVLPVQILDTDAPVTIVSIADWNPNALAVAVRQGSTVQDIMENQLFQGYTTAALRCEGENGEPFDADICWDFSALDFTTPGVYTLVGTPAAPEGTVFAEGLVLPAPTAIVSVQAADKPAINCFYLRYPDIRFPWIAPPGELNAVTVWFSEEGGVWRELAAVNKAWVSQDEVWINLEMFTAGKSYRVQVDYEGGQTGILSFSWDDTIVIDGYWEGDRDSGDTDGSKPPDITLPPPTLPDSGNQDGGDHSSGDGDNSGGTSTPTPTPTPEPTPSPEPSPPPESTPPIPSLPVEPAPSIPPIQSEQPVFLVPEQDKPVIAPVAPQTPTPEQTLFTEESGETTSRLSGARLHTMAVGGETRFSKQGITVALSAKALETLSVADDSIFSIEIERRSDTEFSFSVAVDDVAVTELADTKIALPYAVTDEASMLSLKDESGNAVSTGSYDTQRKLAAFTVDAAGCYTIAEEAVPAAAFPSAPAVVTKAPAAEPPAENGTATMPLLLGAVCLLALGGVFLWNRRGKR